MTPEALGFVPSFLSEDDKRGAKAQFDANYQFGGWQPFGADKFRLTEDNHLCYPGDPPQVPRAMTTLRDELVVFYDHAIVAIIQPDRTFEVARLD